MKFENYTDPSGRFRLRELEARDFPDIELLNRQLFYSYIRHVVGVDGYMKEGLEAKNAEIRDLFYIAITSLDEDRVIGMIDIVDIDRQKRAAEVAYFLSPKFQKQGIASAALGVTIEALGPLGLEKLTASADPENEPSNKLLKTMGFTQSGFKETSQYLGNPDNPLHYDDKRNLQLRPRLEFEADVSVFLEKFRDLARFRRPDFVAAIPETGAEPPL